MRDIAITLLIAAAFLVALRMAWVAPLLWAWLGMMNPQRLAYGFAYGLPFSQIAAGLTLLLFLMPQNRFGWADTSTTRLLLVFYVWVCITSLVGFSLPAFVYEDWIKVTKIQLMLFVSLCMLRGRLHINALVWVLVVSLGFYGVKGGIFTIAKGGSAMVMGPPGTFIEVTNHVAIAMLMVVPLMFYLTQQMHNRWQRWGMFACMGLTMLSVLGTTSRGALLGTLTMAALLGMKSRRKLLTTLLLIAALAAMFIFMPEQWDDKMAGIRTHEDASAQSRLYTWKMIWNLALHHPIFGGGYSVTTLNSTWETYAVTEYAMAYSPHSIYFQALAEHGFVGLALYLAIGISAWRRANWVVREAPALGLLWASQLCRMVQASLAGFAIGGAFVNLVNYDLPYYMVALIVLCDLAVRESKREAELAAKRQVKAERDAALLATRSVV